MANLGDFLGGLMSSISDARVNSDLQSLKIAEEYSKNDMLRHFTVPRMRIDKVELNVPVAIDSVVDKVQTIYKLNDPVKFLALSTQQILRSIEVDSISDRASKELNTIITEEIKLLEEKLRANQIENALETYSTEVAAKTVKLINPIYKEQGRKELSRSELLKRQIAIFDGLQAVLKDEIKSTTEHLSIDSLQVIVQADKLREIKPENMIIIKMTVSEQGMEWISMENNKGEIVTKLMPE